MMNPIPLIHPIYLDVPMLVSFAAALDGGVAFGAEITRETSQSRAKGGGLAVRAGLSNMLSRFIDIGAEGTLSRESESSERSASKEVRAHTEASIAILLYDRLKREEGYVAEPRQGDDFASVEIGSLVEVAGRLEKNAIDSIIDCVDAVNILASLGNAEDAAKRPGGTKTKSASVSTKNALELIRDALHKDRTRTPFSNTIMHCRQPKGATALITLKTANLRDLTLSELHKNSVKVVGKVTRVVGPSEQVCPFENYGMSLLKAEMLEEMLLSITSLDAADIQLSAVRLNGPAVQILPLMVFV